MAAKANLGQWSTKYRPKSLKTFLENESAKSKVESIARKKDTHAILFHGETGCGKTTLARILANMLTTIPSDITEKNIADEKSIENIRGLIRSSQFLPQGPFKIYILDEVHVLSGQTQSAILKTLEEPEHDRVVWMLCTDRPHTLDRQLLNRLYKIKVDKPSEMGLAKLLYQVAKKEEAFDYEENEVKRICKEISRASDHVPRQALQLLKEVSDSKESFKSWKDLVLNGVRKVADQSIDKTAIQVIMAIYSDQKSVEERAVFLMNQLMDKDLWGLTLRLVDIHYQLLNTVAGFKGGAGYYHHKALSEFNAIPDLRLGMKVSLKLVEMRTALKSIDTQIQHYVVPTLMNILYHVESLREAE